MDRLEAMRTFVAVVEEGSFTRAAERLGHSPQLASKYVSQLEQSLGTRLLNRTTRRVNLTEAGGGYYQRAQQVLVEIEEMESQLGELQHRPRGLLRISAPVSFASRHLPRLLSDFRKAYPQVQIDLHLNDRRVDIVEEGFDVALRIGQLKDSSMIARKIAPINLVLVASPDYLAEHGTPRTPGELAQHQFLKYSYSDDNIPLDKRDGARMKESGISCNNGDVLVEAAVQGAGIALQPTFIAAPAIANGSLVTLMHDHIPPPMGLYAIYAHRQLLASKVRCFIDFIDGYFGSPPAWDQGLALKSTAPS
ncbi:DNA-binding transcriptional regulator, LysR family [Ferrimonas sediminum]|uniref:DNA-binding transcriptional regulator, LysR family n=1 Tax=Ferrimonas sediminum TaxID=718193 RepID=A0A1G8R296_9GAMM|nr:LysR family transcriptional regulator [Ferrimonas sediminum]SDJ11106.1 DNA-binding transcriptional regulator, LysR family [Ferrimonas sediminum]